MVPMVRTIDTYSVIQILSVQRFTLSIEVKVKMLQVFFFFLSIFNIMAVNEESTTAGKRKRKRRKSATTKSLED